MSDASDNETFNVDDYKVPYESEEHWELRKAFMEAHIDKFGEDKVVCLARVFTNIELLGCKYSPDVMIQIGELSKGIVDDYRKSRSGRLQRTLKSSNEAAQNKVQRK